MPTISPDRKRQTFSVIAVFCCLMGLVAVGFAFATLVRHPDTGLTLMAVGICALAAGVLVSVRGRAVSSQ